MITPGIATQHAQRIVDALGDHVRTALANDPQQAAQAYLDLHITLATTRTQTKASTCPVDGIYFAANRSIVVHRSSSNGRVRFTLLHEVAHSLIDDDDDLTDRLLAVRNERSAWAREHMANEIASRLLLPDAMVDRSIPFDRGPRASDVIDLIQASNASIEACAVAAARRLPGPGYVLVVEPGGRIRFAAAHGATLPIARHTDQPDGHFLSYATDSPQQARDVTLRFPHGGNTDPMHADSQPLDPRLAVAVLVNGPASWVHGTTALSRPTYDSEEVECPRCHRTKVVYKAACHKCGHRRCGFDDCGWCPCASVDIEELLCSDCSMMKPAAIVVDGICRDCRQ